jgi:MoxR-like ATPase
MSMSKENLNQKVSELTYEKSDRERILLIGKTGKHALTSEPYEFDNCFLTNLVGRKKEMLFITAAWMNNKNTPPLTPVLVGAPGVGKNRLIYEIARKADKELYILQGHEDITAEDMACTVRFSDNGNNSMDYVLSPLSTAMMRGAICLIDEIGKIRPRALALLASVLDERRYIDSTLLGERIHARPGFRFIGATNTGEVSMLPEFIRSRLWPVITVGYPDKDEIKNIIELEFSKSAPQMDELFDSFWFMWEKKLGTEKRPTPRDAIHIFSLASNLCDLESGRYSADKGNMPDVLPAQTEALSNLKLNQSHIASALDYLVDQGAI